MADMLPGHFICTKDDPYTITKALPYDGRCAHPDATEVESSSDYVARFHCPNCGTRWSQELPE